MCSRERRMAARLVVTHHVKTNGKIVLRRKRDDGQAALRFTDEKDSVTVGVLHEVSRPTLLDQMKEIERRARGDRNPPTFAEIVATCRPPAA
jgi:hypothetical protein